MPVKDLYNFDAGGIDYYIKYDTDAQAVFTETVPDNATPAQLVSPLQLGIPVTAVLYHECEGTTLIKVNPSASYPFARVVKSINNRSCGYVPGGPMTCAWSTHAPTVQNETRQGASDGIITINVMLFAIPPTLEYSLDNINWQTSKTFSGLAPGNYRWYVRSSNGQCKKEGTFSIAAGAPGGGVVYPWEDKFCHFFRMVRNGIDYDIEEPGKWDGVNIKGARDKDWHGWKQQYSDEILELEFDCAAGKDILDAEYQANGSDGMVEFKYGISYNGADHVFFDGKVNFNTYKNYGYKCTASVESVEYNPIIQTRYETKVSMTDTQSVDGVAIAPPPITTITLHSKELSKLFRVQSTEPVELDTEFSATKKWYISPDTTAASATEIEETFSYPLQKSADAPYDNDLYQHKIKYKGTYNFNIQYSLTLKYRTNIGSGTITARHYFMINDSKQQVGATVVVNMVSGTFNTTTLNFSYANTHDLAVDDEIFYWTELDVAAVLGAYHLAITQPSIDITISALEQAAESSCNGWFLFDAINHDIRAITNGTSYLKSNFLSLKNAQQASDGPGSLFFTTNGKQIRNFDTSNNPLTISAKELLESARAIFCLGKGFENIAGVDVLRVERVNYFYRNREIIVIEDVVAGSYYEEAAKDLIYNEYEIGYEKYKDEGFNTLDEYNTKNEGTTPMQTNKLKLTVKSSLITSGYTIEDGRRQQFAITSTNSYSNDEEGFLISARRSGTKYVPERNEAFDVVENVISPATAYNLRISPARMLLNWAIWLRNVFHKKPTTAIIKPSLVVQNGALKTQLKATDPNPIGDINRQPIVEKGAIDLANYPVEERLFMPDWIYFKARITPDKIQMINKAMKGGWGSDKDYGYIVVKDDKGLYQAGWIYDLDYNYFTEKATIKLLKKWDSPVQPGEECCSYWAIDGCRVLVNGQKIVI